jgi:PPP family 3-phenylpropionic acid transporter
MHAGSFALTHFATMQLLDRIAGDRLPVAQTLYFSLGSGAFTGLATFAAGYLYENYGGKGYAAMAVMCAIGVTIVLTHKLRNRGAAPA